MAGQSSAMVKHEETKVAAHPIIGRGVKIGGGVETRKGEWRCNICKFKNQAVDEDGQEVDKCKMCKENKTVMKETVPMPAANKVPKPTVNG